MLPSCSRAAAEALPAGWRWAGLAAILSCQAALVVGFGLWTLCWICHVTLLVTWLGLLLPSRRLLSATLPVSLSINVLWTLDALSTLAGMPLFGWIPYVVDPTVPLSARLATWFHAVHPIAMLLIVRRIGYHPQALWLAIAEVAGLLVCLRLALILGLLPAGMNPNWVMPDPAWGFPGWLDSWLYNAFQVLGAVVGLILPVHLMLRRLCRPPVSASPSSTEPYGGLNSAGRAG